MGDSNEADLAPVGEQYIGVGLGCTVDDWTVAANWGKHSEEEVPNENDRRQRGYAFIVNYDLGGGAGVQLGYSKTDCYTAMIAFGLFDRSVDQDAECGPIGESYRRISLGVAMSF